MDDIGWKLEAALEVGLTPLANAVGALMRGITEAVEQIMLPIIRGTREVEV